MSNSLGKSLGSNNNINSEAPFYIGRVKSTVLNPYVDNTKTPNPDYKTAADIGKIRFDRIYSSVTNTKFGNENDFAYPMFSFIKQYPLVGEIVAIFYGPSDGLNDNKDSQRLFYMPAFALWNAVNHNVMPNILEYSQFLSNYVKQPEYKGSAGTPPELPKGYTFTESDSIRSLTNFEGDSIIEGRYGQSIRFGSTVTGFKGYNPWSNTGANGSPITIIRNGQGNITNPVDKFATAVEDINTDKASIYMTSGQTIVLEDLNNFPMNSYSKAVASTEVAITPSIFEKPTSQDFSSAANQDKRIFNQP
jgi:hypothetical protein